MRHDPDRAHPGPTPTGQDGFVLVTLLVILFPVLLLLGASSSTVVRRSSGFTAELAEQRAMLAAEAGMATTLYRIATGQLAPGAAESIDLGTGSRFAVDQIYWKTDGVDNDGDSAVDETDENAYHVRVRGTFAQSVAVLGTTVTVPPPNNPIPSALFMEKNISYQNDNTTVVSGWDKKLSGAAGTHNVPALTYKTAAQVSWFTSNATPEAEAAMRGPGGTPSVAVAPAPQLNMVAIRNYASTNKEVTLGSTFSGSFGNASAGIYKLAYRGGDLDMQPNAYGAGVLVITGKLNMQAGARFDGILVVFGDVQIQESLINGALLVGKDAPAVQIQKTKVQYCTETLGPAVEKLGTTIPSSTVTADPSLRGWHYLPE